MSGSIELIPIFGCLQRLTGRLKRDSGFQTGDGWWGAAGKKTSDIERGWERLADLRPQEASKSLLPLTPSFFIPKPVGVHPDLCSPALKKQ